MNPQKSHADRDRSDQQPVKRQISHRGTAQPTDDARELQPDEHEYKAVQQEDKHVPHRARDDAHLGRHNRWRIASANKTSRNHREHAGDMHGFGNDVRHVGNGERGEHFDHGVTQVLVDGDEQKRQRHTNTDATE